jgi:hypothetical protein
MCIAIKAMNVNTQTQFVVNHSMTVLRLEYGPSGADYLCNREQGNGSRSAAPSARRRSIVIRNNTWARLREGQNQRAAAAAAIESRGGLNALRAAFLPTVIHDL